jgi:hypothetical protein
MRVTKIIREYVEKTVESKMPFGKPAADYKEATAQMQAQRKLLNEQVTAYATSLIESANATLPEGFVLSIACGDKITSTDYRAPLREESDKHQREVREKRRRAIDTILVELELGATKADLERLIAEAIGE